MSSDQSTDPTYRAALAALSRRDIEVDRLRAELARVRAERDRLFADVAEEWSIESALESLRGKAAAASWMPEDPEELAAALAEHDRKATEGSE